MSRRRERRSPGLVKEAVEQVTSQLHKEEDPNDHSHAKHSHRTWASKRNETLSHIAIALLAFVFPTLCSYYPSYFPKAVRTGFLLVFSILFACHMFIFHAPIRQPLAYHNFADQRALFGGCIPNTYDVLSNVPFFLAGVHGLRLLYRPDIASTLIPLEWYGWWVFAVGVLLVSIGSAYYHWAPNNKTLVWDRLPMTIGFMSLFAIIIEERINIGKELGSYFLPAWIFAALLLVGAFSVFYWDKTDDLRPYILVQAFPIIAIPILMAIFPAQYVGRGMQIMFAVGLYAAAKITESLDKEIFTLTGQTISGHSIKHLLAAWACFVICDRIADKPLR